MALKGFPLKVFLDVLNIGRIKRSLDSIYGLYHCPCRKHTL